MAMDKQNEKLALDNKNKNICEFCNTTFKNKTTFTRHKGKCVARRTCKWCKIVFKSRGNLVTHEYHVHGDKSVKNEKERRHTCTACPASYMDWSCLKYHVRTNHFNLEAKIPLFENKNNEDIWYEKVFNTNIIVEIQKINNFKLSLERYNSKDTVNVEESETMVSLSKFYKTKLRKDKVCCKICNVHMLKRVYKKHYDEKHSDIVKHVCNNCNATFKRSYFFIRHVCSKQRSRRNKQDIDETQNVNPTVT